MLTERGRMRLERLAFGLLHETSDEQFDLDVVRRTMAGGHPITECGCLMGNAPRFFGPKELRFTNQESDDFTVDDSILAYAYHVAGMCFFDISIGQALWLFYTDEYAADKWPESRLGAVTRVRAFLAADGDLERARFRQRLEGELLMRELGVDSL